MMRRKKEELQLKCCQAFAYCSPGGASQTSSSMAGKERDHNTRLEVETERREREIMYRE